MSQVSIKPTVCVGGIGPIWGTQYRQGNRVYHGDLALAVLAQPVGNLGGLSYLYLIKEKRNVHQTSN